MNAPPLLQMVCTLRHGPFELRADFTLHHQVTGLYGPSGCGKTTLLHAIAGLLRPHDGFIKLADTPLVNVKGGWWTPPHQRRIGLLFQENRLFPHLTVQDNVQFGYHRIPRAVRRLHPDDVIGLLRLEPLLGRAVTHLSGGEARRVALARTLLTSPRLLLLDEPLTGLDPALRRDLISYLMDLPRKLDIPLLCVSHTRAELLALAQHVLVIRDGAVQALGAPERLLDEVWHDEALESFLDGVVESADEHGYVKLRVGPHLISALGHQLALGSAARVAVPAHEVLLAVGAPPRTSARNVLTTEVAELRMQDNRVLVGLELGARLWAEITPAAARELDLAPGRPVHVLLKARGLRALPVAD